VAVTVHEVSPLFRRGSQQSRTTDTGAMDTDEPLELLMKPVRFVSLSVYCRELFVLIFWLFCKSEVDVSNAVNLSLLHLLSVMLFMCHPGWTHIICCYLNLASFLPTYIRLWWYSMSVNWLLSQQVWQCVVVVNTLASINVVNRHWARLLLGWMTACGHIKRLGM